MIFVKNTPIYLKNYFRFLGLLIAYFSFSSSALFAQTYCSSFGSTDYNDGITLVEFNTINNATTDKTSAYTDFTSISTSLAIGNTYDLTLNLNTDGNWINYAKVWIDWNDDGDFEDSNEEYDLGSIIDVTDGATSNSPYSISVPTTASSGTIRMRVSTKYNSYPTACETAFDGEVEDYTLNLVEVNTVPSCVSPLYPSDGEVGVSEIASLSWDASVLATGYKLYLGTDASATNMENGIDLVNVTSYTPTSDFAFSTDYYWKVVPYNSFGDASGCDIWSFKTDLVSYCNPSVTNNMRYINRVQIGTIDNSSLGTGFTPGGYTDYTNLSTDLVIGQTDIPITVDVYSNTGYAIQVWIDWDRDGEFTQTNDNIICDYGMDNNGDNSESYIFNLPISVTVGETRMRVRLIYDNSSCDDPCLDFTYGEVEDYTVNIIDITSPVITTSPSDTIISSSLCDPNDPVFSDNYALDKVTWEMTGATTASSPSVGFNYVGSTTFNEGTTTITYTATDASGNAITYSFNVFFTRLEFLTPAQTGLTDSVFLIQSPADLVCLSTSSFYWDKYICQVVDVDFDDSSWGLCGGDSYSKGDWDFSGVVNNSDDEGFVGIGSPSLDFTGTYQGALWDGTTLTLDEDRSIQNLYIERDDWNPVGLFVNTDGAYIKDVHLTDADVSTRRQAGALIGYADNSRVDDCSSSGRVFVTTREAGGLIGFSSNIEIRRSSSSCTVICTTADQLNIGGLVGKLNSSGTIINCSASGDVYAPSAGNVGGLVGLITFSSTVEGSYATGFVHGGTSVGGLIGYSNKSTVSNSYSAGAIMANSVAGSFAGTISEESFDSCYATGNVSLSGATTSLGAFVGSSLSGASYNDCYYDEETTGAIDSSLNDLSSGDDAGITALATSDYAVSSNFSLSAPEWRFDNNTYGRPYLAWQNDVSADYNVSNPVVTPWGNGFRQEATYVGTGILAQGVRYAHADSLPNGWIDVSPATSTSGNAFTIDQTVLDSGVYYVQPYIVKGDSSREYGDMTCRSIVNVKLPDVILSPPDTSNVLQPICGDNYGSVVLSGLPSGIEWKITQNPGDADSVNYIGFGTNTTISGLSSGTYTFKVDKNSHLGLSADYYNLGYINKIRGITDLSSLSDPVTLSRIDSTVNFDWGNGSPDISIDASNFAVHWEGQVLPLYSEEYTFTTTSDDGIRLWVDGDAVIDQWVDQAETSHTGTIALVAGKRYNIVLEYFENTGQAVAQLEWSSASQAQEIIPKSQLFPDAFAADYIASSVSEPVTINSPLLTIFDVSVGGDYCLESEMATVSLSASETNVTYQLYDLVSDNAVVGAQIVGTGFPISFTGITSEGTYSVWATHDTNGCSSMMSDSAVIYNTTPGVPLVDTIIQPICVNATGSVVLNNLPSQWQIFQTPGDTILFGEDSSTTIPNLKIDSTYKFSVATHYEGTGLLGEYYNNKFDGQPILTRIDPVIDFVLGRGSPGSPVGIDNYSVRWTGQVQAIYSELYTFWTRSDDGIRLWVNGTNIVDEWTDHGNTYYAGTIALDAGESYDIVLEFYEKGGDSRTQLGWTSASQASEIIPKSQLTPYAHTDDACFSSFSEDVLISFQPVMPIAPDTVTVDRNVLGVADPDSITLSALGGLGCQLRWYKGACGGTAVGTDTVLTIPSPSSTTRYFALWETSLGLSDCLSLEVTVLGMSTDSVTKIGETTATFYGSIPTDRSIVEYGFYYSTDNDESNLVNGGSALAVTAYSGVAIDLVDEVYSCDVTGLINRSAYYFRAYMKDALGNYYYGKVIRFLSEKRDFSLALDGDGDFLLIDSTTTHDVINDWGPSDNTFSVDFWMRNASTNTAKMVLVSDTCHNGTNHTGYLIAYREGCFYFQSGGTMNKTDFVVFDQEWHHVACTYNNGPVSVYIDDSLINCQHSSLTLRRPNVNVNCKIGSTGDPTDPTKFYYFNGNIDAMRFWNVALTADQISVLCYHNVQSNPSSNTITCIASGQEIAGLTADNLTASLGFNVMSTQESVGTIPVDSYYPSQDSLHALPFFHADTRLPSDSTSFNIVAVGDAHPSPYLPRVHWRSNSTDSVWMTSSNWGGFAYPGQGVVSADYPDVSASDLANDSAYCLYTIVDSSAIRPVVKGTPPEVQILVDKEGRIGTYRVDESDSKLTILKGIYPRMFDAAVIDSQDGAIVIEEGSMEYSPE